MGQAAFAFGAVECLLNLPWGESIYGALRPKP